MLGAKVGWMGGQLCCEMVVRMSEDGRGTNMKVKPKVTQKTQEEQGRECRGKWGRRNPFDLRSALHPIEKPVFSAEQQCELPLPFCNG